MTCGYVIPLALLFVFLMFTAYKSWQQELKRVESIAAHDSYRANEYSKEVEELKAELKKAKKEIATLKKQLE